MLHPLLRPLAPVHLYWEGDLPHAVEYDDVYFSAHDPCGEVQAVFIEANELPARFQRAQRFTIGETGFGTGLNFFLTLQTWRRHAPADAFLSYLSAEAHPLAPADLHRSLHARHIPEADIAHLLTQYPPPLSGIHRIHFPADRVVLTLVYGDAAPEFARLRGEVDAWFLDGFAPNRNPALWNIAVFRQLARLSHPGTTLGTFTVAGQVRRDLTEAGFEVHKQPGFSGKRERLVGRFPDHGGRIARTPGPVAVVGAGIAGLATALALRERGVAVQVFDPAGIGGRTSGNPAALLTPHLSAGDTPRNTVALAGIRATLALLAATGASDDPDIVLAQGVEHRGVTRHAARRLARLAAVDPQLCGGIYEVIRNDPRRPMLRYPQGLALDLGALCRRLGGGTQVLPHRVIAVRAEADGVTLETAEGGQQQYAAVVLSTGATDRSLCPGQPIPSLVGGQMTRIKASLPAVGPLALSGKGYCLPERDGQHWLGATYRRDAHFVGVRDEDNAANLRHLGWVDAALKHPASVQVSGAWFGVRAVWPDRFPAVGALVRDADTDATATAPPQCAAAGPGTIYLNLGHGSRGLLYAPLAAQLLADRICGLPEPLPDVLSDLFSPYRIR